MPEQIKFVHTNLIARDWKKLAQFYIDVFGCEQIGKERDLMGNWIDRVTGIKKVRIQGVHLKLPGYKNGPTLEIFQYEPNNYRLGDPLVNGLGFGHIAFHVENVAMMLAKITAHGGSQLGEYIEKQYQDNKVLKVVYTRDPEGNIVELQKWDTK